jgi:hypothetical protein
MMKKIIFLVLLMSGINSAIAECGMRGMQFFPETEEISLSSMFIIQGYAISQHTINSFKDRRVYLESEHNELIELNLQDILQGVRLTQAVFCPATELKPNTTYHLKYAGQTERETSEMNKWYPEIRKTKRIFWKTTDLESAKKIVANLSLEFQETEVVQYGCGPDAYAIFNILNKPAAETWYKTELTDLSNNNTNIFYLTEQKGKLSVGHGMCSGAFSFNSEGNYKVRFIPMNIDGKALKTTTWFTFKSPYSKN